MSSSPKDGREVAILEHYRRCYQAGSLTAARAALWYCAAAAVTMPDWLAGVVKKAINISDKGKPDDLLGFGNAKMLVHWRKNSLQARNDAIRRSLPFSETWHKKRDTGVTKTQLIKATADTHGTSIKNIEKILYAPTSKPKK